MSAVGTITLTGKSGYPRSTEFKPLGAIYVMAKEKDSSTYTLIYIGETGDASKRPFNHHRKDCFDKNGATFVFIHLEANAKRRLDIETDLRGHYDPV
jgi:hypothetical protein